MELTQTNIDFLCKKLEEKLIEEIKQVMGEEFEQTQDFLNRVHILAHITINEQIQQYENEEEDKLNAIKIHETDKLKHFNDDTEAPFTILSDFVEEYQFESSLLDNLLQASLNHSLNQLANTIEKITPESKKKWSSFRDKIKNWFKDLKSNTKKQQEKSFKEILGACELDPHRFSEDCTIFDPKRAGYFYIDNLIKEQNDLIYNPPDLNEKKSTPSKELSKKYKNLNQTLTTDQKLPHNQKNIDQKKPWKGMRFTEESSPVPDLTCHKLEAPPKTKKKKKPRRKKRLS